MEKKMKFLVVLAVIVVGFIFYIGIFGLSFEGTESDFYVPVVKGDNISAYKNSCSELNLSEVSDNSEALIGQKIKVTGQIQGKDEFVQFDKTRTNIDLKVPGLSPDPYIIVIYSETVPFKQGDMVTVYGEYYFPVQNQMSSELANKNLPAIKTACIEKA